MKIVICGSMGFSGEMIRVREKLVLAGHKVILPRHAEEYAKMNQYEIRKESTKNKIKEDLIRDYYEEIKKSDAVLIVNPDKGKIKDYIGGNSFLELAFAHVLNKRCYILNDIPEMVYSDEIHAMQPTCLKGSLFEL